MRLQWYIFRILARSFLLTLVLVTGTVFLVGTLQSFGRYQDVSLAILFSRLPYLIPFALTFAIPLALLIGTILAYGRLAADNEYLAMKMGGIHPLRAITPALAFGVALAVLNLWVIGTLAPRSMARARAITRDDLRNFLTSLEESRKTEFSSDRVEMKWSDADPDGALLDVDFDLSLDEGLRLRGHARKVTIAKDEELSILKFRFWDLRATRTSEERLGEIIEVAEHSETVAVESLFAAGRKKERREVITNDELRFRAVRDPLLGRDPDDEKLLGYRTEIAARTSLALACIVFVLVGVPIGLLFRHGSFVGAGFIAILIAFLIYYPLHEVGWNLSYQGKLAPGLAMSIPGVVVGGVGVFLLAKVLRR